MNGFEVEKINVNDGGGLLDNVGLIDTLIVDCNALLQLLIGGRYVAFCAKVVEMVQKLSNLKNGVHNDTESLRKEVEALKQDNENLVAQLFQNEKVANDANP